VTILTDCEQKLCRFTISNKRDPKQEFVTYELVSSSSRRETLIRNKERELHTEISGYKVSAFELVDLVKNVNEVADRKENNGGTIRRTT
jgi:hypothetical protein